MFLKYRKTPRNETSPEKAQPLLDHIAAGEAYNNLVRDLNLSSYFGKALDKLQLPSLDNCVAVGHEFANVVPGRPPKDELDRLVYDHLLRQIKQPNDIEIKGLLLLMSLILEQQNQETVEN